MFQQKNHPGFDPDLVLKWSFEALGQYITEELEVAPADFLKSQLMPRIRRILATVSLAARASLQRGYPAQGDCFAVFEADLIIDKNLTSWLSEIQKGPGLSLDDPVKLNLIPPMLGEAARIGFELRKRHKRGAPLTDLKSVNNYQWSSMSCSRIWFTRLRADATQPPTPVCHCQESRSRRGVRRVRRSRRRVRRRAGVVAGCESTVRVAAPDRPTPSRLLRIRAPTRSRLPGMPA